MFKFIYVQEEEERKDGEREGRKKRKERRWKVSSGSKEGRKRGVVASLPHAEGRRRPAAMNQLI